MSQEHRFLAPEYVRRIVPYRPGRPVDLIRSQLALEHICQLASNENTSGPSPLAVERMRGALTETNLYPDGGGHHLRHELAARSRVSAEAIYLGNGSGELVDLLCRAFVADGDRVVMSKHGFVQYRLSAQAVNAEIVEVAPRPETLADDASSLAETATRCGARLVFLANPNNPTGTYVTRDELDAYFRAIDPGVLTVIDQAYFEYVEVADYPDALDDLAAGHNVVVLRTFSKIYGLAALRIGYAVGPPEVLAQIEGVRLPFNTNALAQVAAHAALDDVEHVESSRRRNQVERAYLCEGLSRRAIRFQPSIGNFLMVDFERPAGELFDQLLERGVLVRPLLGYGFPTCQRITVGTRDENDQLLAALDAIGRGRNSAR